MRTGLIVSVFWCLSCCLSIAQNQQQATEIAVYHIRSEKQGIISAILRDVRKNIANFKGFQDYRTLRSLGEKGVYVDILHWKSTKDAEKASRRVQSEPHFASFLESIDSIYAYGDFLPYYLPIKSQKTMKTTQNITEVVMYQIKQGNLANYTTLCKNVDNELRNFPGFISRTVLQDHKDPSIFVDIVVWESLDDAQNAPKKAETLPTMQPFFAATERVISFQHYTTFIP